MADGLKFVNQSSSEPPSSNYRNRSHRKDLLRFKDKIIQWHRAGLSSLAILEKLELESNGKCTPSKGQLDAQLRIWGLSRYIKRDREPTFSVTLIPTIIVSKPVTYDGETVRRFLQQARKAFACNYVSLDNELTNSLQPPSTRSANDIQEASSTMQYLENRQRMIESITCCLQSGLTNPLLVANILMMALSYIIFARDNETENSQIHIHAAKAMMEHSIRGKQNGKLFKLLVSLIQELERREFIIRQEYYRQPPALRSKFALFLPDSFQMRFGLLATAIGMAVANDFIPPIDEVICIEILS